jgi:hypothetical protein
MNSMGNYKIVVNGEIILKDVRIGPFSRTYENSRTTTGSVTSQKINRGPRKAIEVVTLTGPMGRDDTFAKLENMSRGFTLQAILCEVHTDDEGNATEVQVKEHKFKHLVVVSRHINFDAGEEVLHCQTCTPSTETSIEGPETEA